MKIILAGSYPEGTIEKFREALPQDTFAAVTEQSMLETLRDAECMILRILKAPKQVITNNRHLKAILRWGAGYDSVDIEAAGKQGVLVANVPGANAYAVAELAVGMMIALGRDLRGCCQSVQDGVWERTLFARVTSLNNKTVGLIGGGSIGRQVAKRVQAFGAKVQYYDVFRLGEETEREYGLSYVPFEALLETSDLVSLHVPLTDDTYHLIGQKELGRMKKTALLINTARGGLIDEDALLAALREDRLAGAGLDGVEEESSKTSIALSQRSEVLLTPHVGGTTSDLADAMIPRLIRQIKQLKASGKITETVNLQYLL
ncbi:MAG: 3-phosphoglycerate dehydrogenase [Lachnospiraceae bacterium]|nr:3-phosphoglycerate dehydrogenase [Lachnospiraceae bacterium]